MNNRDLNFLLFFGLNLNMNFDAFGFLSSSSMVFATPLDDLLESLLVPLVSFVELFGS